MNYRALRTFTANSGTRRDSNRGGARAQGIRVSYQPKSKSVAVRIADATMAKAGWLGGDRVILEVGEDDESKELYMVLRRVNRDTPGAFTLSISTKNPKKGMKHARFSIRNDELTELLWGGEAPQALLCRNPTFFDSNSLVVSFDRPQQPSLLEELIFTNGADHNENHRS